MEMKKTEIAILDSGIDENILALYGLYDVIQHSEGHTDDNGDLFMHGTNCAIIIGWNCANVRLYSYKILDGTGRGDVSALESALRWCLSNGIRLVNLSFGTTHFKDKGKILRTINHYANRGLIIVAATANSGYTAYPASFSSVIGVRTADTFGTDDESLCNRGVDFTAPSQHEFQLADKRILLQRNNSYAAPYVTAMIGQLLAMKENANVWQIKKQLYLKAGKDCVQYVPDWIENGWIFQNKLISKADVYFDVVKEAENADTVILYDGNEVEKYNDKHIVYLGRETIEEPDTQYFFWSRKNRETQIERSREKNENINIPVIILRLDSGQDVIWWLTELRKCFEVEGYNAYTVSSETESVLYYLEYIPLDADTCVRNKIVDFIYWQTYYNQSDLIVCGMKKNEKDIFNGYAEIFIEIENRGEKTDIVVYCDGIKRTQICFEAIGEKEIREVYNCLIVFLTEDEDEQ